MNLSTEDARSLLSAGPKTADKSLSVAGALSSAALSTVADSTTPGQLANLAAGPSGIRVQNTAALGSPNIRVGDSDVSAARGTQLSPGQWEIFAVANANLLYVAFESGTPSYGVNAA